MAAVNRPVRAASAWCGADLERDRRWEFPLDDGHRDELRAAAAAALDAGLAVGDIDADAFPLPRLSGVLSRVGDELRDGRGFALLRGFPVEDCGRESLEAMYWGLCSHVGVGLTQNSDAGLIHYVTEGPLRPRQGKRGVGFPRKAPLHIDLTDVVSLLCVRQAPDDPPSWVASSTAVYNALVERRPELLPCAARGFPWDRMDEHGAGESPASEYRVPVFSRIGDTVSAQYNRNWISCAAERSGRGFTDEETALLDFIDEAAHAARFEFSFGAGDVQFCSNYTVFHGRQGHAVEADPDRRRLLMRIWLDVPGFRDFADEAIVRYGNGRHGQIGWTAAELRSGANRLPRRRRPDGAIDLAPS